MLKYLGRSISIFAIYFEVNPKNVKKVYGWIEGWKGVPGGSNGTESACSVGKPGSIPGSGRSPGGGNGNPLQYSCLENPMERSLADYSSWGHKESGMTE